VFEIKREQKKMRRQITWTISERIWVDIGGTEQKPDPWNVKKPQNLEKRKHRPFINEVKQVF